jgi:hypothetical protein
MFLTDNEKWDELLQRVKVVDTFGNETMKVVSISI